MAAPIIIDSKKDSSGEDLCRVIEDLKEYLSLRILACFENCDKKVIYDKKRDDFEILSEIGRGTFGRVFLARLKVEEPNTKCYFALKVIQKRTIIEKNQIVNTLHERNILQSVNFPFIVHLKFYFFDENFIYFGFPFARGGDLYHLLKKHNHFSECIAKFFAAQICLALEYLHYLDVIYRDLKPENILLEEDGYIKLTDFGFSRLLKGKRASSFCGTPEYLAPEIVISKEYGLAVDWWSFGVLIFELNYGSSPFLDINYRKLFSNIIEGKYRTPDNWSDDLRDIVKQILQVDITKRLGNLKNGVDDIKRHGWFREINWLGLLNREMEAPFKPPCVNPEFFPTSADCKTFFSFYELSPSEVDLYFEKF